MKARGRKDLFDMKFLTLHFIGKEFELIVCQIHDSRFSIETKLSHELMCRRHNMSVEKPGIWEIRAVGTVRVNNK